MYPSCIFFFLFAASTVINTEDLHDFWWKYSINSEFLCLLPKFWMISLNEGVWFAATLRHPVHLFPLIVSLARFLFAYYLKDGCTKKKKKTSYISGLCFISWQQCPQVTQPSHYRLYSWVYGVYADYVGLRIKREHEDIVTDRLLRSVEEDGVRRVYQSSFGGQAVGGREFLLAVGIPGRPYASHWDIWGGRRGRGLEGVGVAL